MTAPQEEYRITFIRRTKEMLEKHYDELAKIDREVTFLMNCLLGLIVTISQNEKKDDKVHKKFFNKPIDEGFLDLIPDKFGFAEFPKNNKLINIDLINPDPGDSNRSIEININVHHKKDLNGKNKSWFIDGIRNGIAHQNIYPIIEGNQWTGVRIWNEYKDKKDFEIIFMIEELKKFVIALSTEYLEEYDNGRGFTRSRS